MSAGLEAHGVRLVPSLPWDHVSSHNKIGPDRFSRFDVYRIQTNKQTDKPNLYIDVLSKSSGVSKDIISTDTTFIVASQIYIELILLQHCSVVN